MSDATTTAAIADATTAAIASPAAWVSPHKHEQKREKVYIDCIYVVVQEYI